MSEKLFIKVEEGGSRNVSQAFRKLGAEGKKAAQLIDRSFSAAMSNMRWQAQVAINSQKLADQARVASARAAAAEIKRLRATEVQAARAALAQERAALRAHRQQEIAAARASAGIARSQRSAAVAQRRKLRDAKMDATFGLGNFGNVLGLIGLKETAAGFITLSDSMANVENRLAIVTGDSNELTSTIQRLRNTSLDARAEFDLTTRTYARLAQSTKMLGITQGANISMTETLTKAISVSGATGAEAHATLIQLSQAMGSNRLSADEFRSVAEQLPIILDLIADSTKRPRQELKEMGEAGKLTARVIALSILEGHDKIENMFKKTKPTIEQSWENIRTQARFAVDAFNKATGAGEALVRVLQYIANNMDTVTVVAKVLGSVVGTYLVAQLGLAAKAMVTLALANPWTAAAVGLAGAISLVVQFRKEIQETAGEFGYFAGIMATPANLMTEEQKNAIRTGKTPMAIARGEKAWSKDQAATNQATTNSFMEKLERQVAIDKLRSGEDKAAKKKGRGGRHVPTFDEAIADMLKENMLLRINRFEREKLNTVLDIQEKIQKKLTFGQKQVVTGLFQEIELRKALDDAQEQLREKQIKEYEDTTRNMVERKRAMEDAREEARRMYVDQLKLENIIHRGQADSISGDDEIKNARRTVKDMVLGGRLSENAGIDALNKLEINDSATNPIRKLFLEETTGIGKFSQQVEGIFGPEGMISKGFSDAIANSLVFKASFKTTIRDLAKQVQAELISSLVQAFIRMAILGGMGGGTPGVGAGKALKAIGTGRSAGGLAKGGRASIAGYHHGGEYIVNAQATQQNLPMLEAINKGGRVTSASSGGGGMNIHFNDYAGVRLETQQLSVNEVQIIARQAVDERAPRVVAATMADQNSRMQKAMRSHTNARAQR